MSKPQSAKNQIIVASAGSRKTTQIVEMALGLKGRRVLLTTYTNENLDQIRNFITDRCGCVPEHITLLSWYSFLLQDGVRPYQSFVTSENRRANSILFEELNDWNRRVPKARADIYFLTKGNDIYKDRVSELVCACDEVSKGLVVKRLERVYDTIFIDEVQDIAGYDLNLLEKLFASSIVINAVGDPRQGIFSTNNSAKNKKYKKSGMIDWISQHQKTGLVHVTEKNECYRCNQTICDFADKLFPEFGKTKSMNHEVTGHDGIFMVQPAKVAEYVSDHKPVVLRWNKSSDTMQLPAINFGASKGRTYNRVLVFPTKPILAYLETKDVEKAGDRSKFYVAVTRAKYSVAFVVG
jgi:DNA helicase II / ATP-dependent DNA helicase PcrA